MEIFSLGETSTADYSVIMAVVDFLPVLFYFLAAWLAAKDLYNKVDKTSYAFLSTGAIMCFIGGAYKAVWKLIFALGICNYPFLFTALFPMQAPGFCLYLAGLIMALRQTGKKVSYDSKSGLNMVTVPVVTTSLPFIMFQTIGSIGSVVCLAIFAKRMKQPKAIVCFVLAIVGLLGMGGLGAVLDSSLAWANWLEQGVNAFGQIMFYLGVLILHKNGFAEPELRKE